MDHGHTAALDVAAVKRQQRQSWDAISTGWAASMELFERGAAGMSDALLRLGGVRRGRSVLDIGTGLGEPALPAARAVGPTGRVVGIDISAQMLHIARERAGDLSNVEFLVADLEDIPLPPSTFDVALSRWSLMFAVDHVATL